MPGACSGSGWPSWPSRPSLNALDINVLFLALPQLTRDLGASSTEQLWIIDIYGFLLAGFVITMGTLGDRIGRRKLLFIGGTIFALVSVVGRLLREPGHADRYARPPGDRGGDAHALDPGADNQHVP